MENLNILARRHAGWSRVAVFALVVITLVLAITGVVMHVWSRDAALEVPEWQASLLHMSTVTHGVLTWLFCMLAGRWIWPHVVLVWHRRAHTWVWVMGIASLGAGALLALAGLGLLYGRAEWHDGMSVLHWWLGMAWPLVCSAHGWRWLKKRR